MGQESNSEENWASNVSKRKFHYYTQILVLMILPYLDTIMSLFMDYPNNAIFYNYLLCNHYTYFRSRSSSVETMVVSYNVGEVFLSLS